MNDILPAQTPLWRYLEGTFAQLLDSYGYSEIRLPIVYVSHHPDEVRRVADSTHVLD